MNKIDAEDLEAIKKLSVAVKHTTHLLASHAPAQETASAYDEIRLLASPKFFERLMKARLKEINDAAKRDKQVIHNNATG